jgi:ATP-binding cassette subfamily F protein 3
MSLAVLDNIEKTFGQRVLFEHLNLNVERGERIGLIGDNGSGKTTLFKLLVGQITPDTGAVSIADGVKLGYLSQDPVFSESTVMDEAELAFASLHGLAHRLRDLEHAMASHAGEALEKTLKQYETVQHEFDLAGGYVWHHRLEATLLGVGLGRETWEQEVQTLSGGQRSRLALAKLLIAEPDLLLLDEPTNHLDLDAVEWLETYLLEFRGAVVLISHDRFLLDRLATRIVWLTGAKLKSYPGNYSAFVQQREVHELTQQRQYEEQQADIEKQKEFIRRFGAGQRSKEAKGREKRLNRLLASDEMIGALQKQKKIHVRLNTDQRAGDRVLKLRDLGKRYGEKVLFEDLRFEVGRGERIGIIGPNGSGKTTLLKVLLGVEDADAGEVKWGANLKIGYYDQRLDDFDPDRTVMEEAWDGREQYKAQQIRDVLAMLLFRGLDIEKTMELLSGGERARVRLAQLLLDKPNVLVMDEPTNHLDIASCEALEAALADFQGTILCVSHDRYFLNKVTSRLLVFQPPGIVDFAGNYSAWAERQKAMAMRKVAEPAKSRRSSSIENRKSKIQNKPNPYHRPFGRLTIEELERQITETEVALAECQQAFAEAGAMKDPACGRRLHADYDQLSSRLRDLEAEYFARET